jgi:hypothetical protein
MTVVLSPERGEVLSSYVSLNGHELEKSWRFDPSEHRDIHGRWSEVLDEISKMPNASIMLRDDSNHHMAVAFGDPKTADHVITYVPGVGEDSDLPHEVKDASMMKDRTEEEGRGSSASVFWLGYNRPSNVGSATSKKSAVEGSGNLARFQHGLKLKNPSAHYTVVGHSYGSLVSGLAASHHGMHPDDLVFIGSPGTGVKDANRLGMDPGHVWAGANSQDPVSRAAPLLSSDFRGSPVSSRYGANIFTAEIPGRVFPGRLHQEAHTSYADSDSQALANIAKIAAGNYDDVDLVPSPELVTSAVIPELLKVGPEGYIHGYICVRPPCGKEPDKISSADLWLKKDGTVIHKPSGYKIGTVDRSAAEGHDWTVFTATHHDGSQVYYGTRKREALTAIADHHNTAVGSTELKPDELPEASKPLEVPEAKPAVAELKNPAVSGHSFDINMLSGSLNDHLSSEQAAEIKGLIQDSHLSFPNPKDEAWGEHGSPGVEKATRLDKLKYTAAQSMMEKAGVPHEAAQAIAGWPEMKTIDQYMPGVGADGFASMKSQVYSWSSIGANARNVSIAFDKARTMDAPEVRPEDFTRHTEMKSYSGKPYPQLVWDDASPEAGDRRYAAATYWGMRAQKYYTQQVLSLLPKKHQGNNLPVVRMIAGAQGEALQNAIDRNEYWKVATRTLSSWAEPSDRSKNTIRKLVQKYIDASQGIGSQMWLEQEVDPNQVYMHWRGEGVLRNQVNVLGEIVVADSQTDSTRAKAVPA